MKLLNAFIALLVVGFAGIVIPVLGCTTHSLAMRVICVLVWLSLIGHQAFVWWRNTLNQ